MDRTAPPEKKNNEKKERSREVNNIHKYPLKLEVEGVQGVGFVCTDSG